MKNFFSSIPNRWKAVYLVWIFAHFILLIMGNSYRKKYFFPFEFDVDVYDFSEFLIYSLTPILFYFVFKLWNEDKHKSDSELNKKTFFKLIMQKSSTEFPNKLKAFYLIWLLFHFLLFMIGGNLFTYNEFFFPFNRSESNLYFLKQEWMITFSSNVYDYSEFFIYTFTPIFIYLIQKYLKSDSSKKSGTVNVNPENNQIVKEKIITDKFEKVDVVHKPELIASTTPDDVKHNYLSGNKLILIRLIYLVYLICWSFIISELSYDPNVLFYFGYFAKAWLLVLIVALFRKLMKKKPTVLVFIFYFVWTTIVAIFDLSFWLNMTKYIQGN